MQSFEEARFAMEMVKPVMLITDSSCGYWYPKLENDHLPSLRWHVFMDSLSEFNSKESSIQFPDPKIEYEKENIR